MTDYGRKARDSELSARSLEKLARKGRSEPSVIAPDGTRNGPAEIAKDRKQATRTYKYLRDNT